MKHLYRSKENKVLFGILGGIGEYYDIDPALIRLAFVFLTLFAGVFPGIIAYFIGIFIVPKRRHEEKKDA